MHNSLVRRREFLSRTAAVCTALGVTRFGKAAPAEWKPRYLLASCLYGETNVAEILPEVSKIGADAIDIWPRVHGNQREQMELLGHQQFAELLNTHEVQLGVLTRFDLGPFRLADELKVAEAFETRLIVTGGAGPVNLRGEELKSAVREFIRQLEPTLSDADRRGVTIAIENHGHNLIDSPDSLRWLAELSAGKPLGIALAPYHLPQDSVATATLIKDLGPKLSLFYAWQHGKGAMKPIPTEDQLQQLPGRGPLDFQPLMAALARIQFAGFVEIFMHPVPRGIPILPTTAEVTAEIRRAQKTLEDR